MDLVPPVGGSASGVELEEGGAVRGALVGAARAPVGAVGRVGREPGQHKGAKFSTFKAHISVSFYSFQLIFGRVIISLQVLERWMLFLTH